MDPAPATAEHSYGRQLGRLTQALAAALAADAG